MSGEWLPPQPPGGQPPSQPPPPPIYQPPPPGYPPQPPNNDAVAGFTCALIGATLLFFTAGLSTVISLVLGIVAIQYSRKGQQNVEQGRTQKHRDLAKAGFVIGIVTVVLSILAIIVWALLFTTLDEIDWDSLDDPNNDPFDDEFDFQRSVSWPPHG